MHLLHEYLRHRRPGLGVEAEADLQLIGLVQTVPGRVLVPPHDPVVRDLRTEITTGTVVHLHHLRNYLKLR